MVVPQVILTLTNSIAATVLIAGDLFKSRISPDRVSTSIGIMNLVSAPLGGIPVCHGAGGVAALYRFGASTSVANFIAGAVLIVIAVFSADHGIVTLFPVGLLGSLLFFVAIDLGPVWTEDRRPPNDSGDRYRLGGHIGDDRVPRRGYRLADSEILQQEIIKRRDRNKYDRLNIYFLKFWEKKGFLIWDHQ